MAASVTIELAPLGPLSRNSLSRVTTIDDPLPAGARIRRITGTAVTRPLFFDLFGKGAVAGQRLMLGHNIPLDGADSIAYLSTFGPSAGEDQAAVHHTFVHEGELPRYAYGGTNVFAVANDYNPVDMGVITLVFDYSLA